MAPSGAARGQQPRPKAGGWNDFSGASHKNRRGVLPTALAVLRKFDLSSVRAHALLAHLACSSLVCRFSFDIPILIAKHL